MKRAFFFISYSLVPKILCGQKSPKALVFPELRSRYYASNMF